MPLMQKVIQWFSISEKQTVLTDHPLVSQHGGLKIQYGALFEPRDSLKTIHHD
jgi:hypothetical protein